MISAPDLFMRVSDLFVVSTFPCNRFESFSYAVKILVPQSTGGPNVEQDYNNILGVYKTMYENASKITLNAMCRKYFE